MSSARTLGLAPRRTASRPATTPPAPARTATQSATVATPADMCSDRRSQGGAAPDLAIGGYIQLSRASDTTIMIRIETAMPATARRTRTRVMSAADRAGLAAGDAELAPVTLGMRLLVPRWSGLTPGLTRATARRAPRRDSTDRPLCRGTLTLVTGAQMAYQRWLKPPGCLIQNLIIVT